MRLRARRSHSFDGLNITPLIDVVFMLLVFFMLATNFARFRLLGVESPDDRPVAATSEGAVVIQVGLADRLLVDNRPVARGDLLQAVGEIVAVDPNRNFLVRPEPGVPLQEAITVYDDARSVGAQAISFSRWRGEAP